MADVVGNFEEEVASSLIQFVWFVDFTERYWSKLKLLDSLEASWLSVSQLAKANKIAKEMTTVNLKGLFCIYRESNY